MFKPGLITAALLTMLLSACGGGESTVAGDNSNTNTGNTDTGNTDTGNTDTGGGTNTNVSEGLGAGSGSAHQPGGLTLSASTILRGGSVTVTANGVDKNDSNNALTNSSYQYTFSSVCASANPATASLSTASTFSTSGEASTVYSNNGCSGTDTITAQLFNQADDISVATPLATATATIQSTAPQLGFGTGVDYRDGKIDGVLDLVGVTETVLTANAVNPLALNALVDSEDYIVSWSSDCDTASFSIPSQTLNNSTIQTRYDADVTNCTGDNTITLTLALANSTSTVLDTTSTIVKVSTSSAGGTVVVPSVGSGTEGDFREGNLTFSSARTVTGTSISISADLVDKNNSNARLASDYQYVFRSDCANPAIPDGATEAPAATASFTLNSAVNSSGSVSTVYTPTGVDCVDSDTITLSVYGAAANPDTDTPIATASRTLDVSLPGLGVGSGADFRRGEFGGNLNLVDVTETTLTANAVNPLDSNSLITSAEYEVSWSSSCTAGDFSIKNQDLSSGSIETRYEGNDDSCQGSNEITLFLSWNNIQLASISQTVSIATTSSNALPALGSGTGADFNEGVVLLSASKAIVGDDIDVNVNLVDKNNSNSALSENYQYVFSSTCAEAATPTATFTVVNTTNNSGLASSRYTNINPACGNSDTITVTLKNIADSSTVATATASIQLAAPRLGFGSGADYRDDEVSGEVSGVVTITDADEATLTANAVDPLSSNASIRSSEYSISWSSDCDDGLDNGADYAFSVQSQDLTNGDISTRYESRCDVNNLTLVLSRAGVRLDELITQVRFENSVSNVDPGVGSGIGTSFREGELSLSLTRALVGQEVLVTADLVDINAGNERLLERYTYEFASTCATAGHSRFSTSALTNSVGTASSAYTNSSIDCGDSDTITVTVKDPSSGAVLDTATAVVELSAPVLGQGIGAEFTDSASDLAVIITGNSETILSADAVNPLDANSAVNSDLYEIRWVETASCAGDVRANDEKFSVVEQTLTSAIETRYIANEAAPACTNTTVTASLYLAGGSDVLDSINIAVTLQQTSSSSATPDIGFGNGDGYIANSLGLSNNNVLVGEPITVTVNLVDSAAQNTLLSERYQFNFTSNCDTSAAFSRANVISSTGTATTTYTPSAVACASGDITVTAQLVDLDTGNNVAGVTATATLNATLPKLGTGTGAEFSDAAADLAVTITGANTTTLTADAVNPLSANTAIRSNQYEVRWTETSACSNGSGGTTAGSFSVESQPLNSAIETRYTAGESAPTCTSSEVTASLYLVGGTEVLDSIVMGVTLEETTTTTATPNLGLGSGDDYIENVLGLSNNNVLVGEPVTVTVNLVDSDALNALLSERYQFNFTSDCDTSAAFSRANVISSTGTATTTYTPSAVACASGDITVTAQLVDLDTGNNVTGVTASATLNATLPKLGTGTGAGFSDAAADLAVTITGTNTTTLTVDAVNPLSANAAISSDQYEVRWTETSACSNGSGGTTAGSFSIESQPLSSAIETRYTAGESAPTCTSSEVTASLYLAGGTEVLDSIVMGVTLEETTTTTATPDLGLGSGDDYIENVLGLSNNNVLVGEPVTVTVNLVDSDALNALLSERYQFNFTSDCDISAAFSRANVISSTGTATTTYTPSAVACASGDITITAQLVDLDTGNNVTGVTATATLNATLPKLGTGTGAEFRDAAADLAVTIKGGNETTLTADAVNPLDAHSSIGSSSYEVRWTETGACASGFGSFSVPSQLLNSSIETRYTSGAAAPICTSSEVTASLYLASGTELLDSIVIDVTLEKEGTNTDQIAIGSGFGDAFLEGDLAFSRSVALIGDALTVSVNLVDTTDHQYSLLSERYRFDFESDCDGSTEFARSETISSTGTASTQYTPSIACIDVDTDDDGVVDRGSIGLTVKLVDADTGAVVTDENSAPIQASGTISVTAPKLGLGIEAEFRDDSSDLAVSLSSNTDETYLVLNAVNPLDANSEVTSPAYWVEWEEISSCLTDGKFSVQRQPLSSDIRTRYEIGSGFEGCGTEVEVKASLYLADGSQSLINAIAVLDTVSIKVTKDSGTAPSTAIPDLGLGSGDDFIGNVLGLSNNNVLLGEPVTVTVNLVDSDALNALLSERYQFNFTSDCDTSAAFSRANVISSTGTATTTYTPSAVACASGDITVTAQLVDLDTGNNVAGVTATATLNATLPKLGTGTGAEFSDAAADLAVTITGTNTTTLTADAVNPLSANAAISSDQYEVRWTETSACSNGSGGTTAGSFSIESQPLSSAIETRYTAGESAPTCTSSEVTASLYLAGGSEVLDSIVMDVTLEETTTTTATPDLGLGSGDDYIGNVLGLSNNNVLLGEPVTVTVNLVDSDAQNTLLSERYQFNFTSDCDTSAAFSRANVISSTGTATTTYTPSAVACASGDITVTAQLVDLDTGNNVTGVMATAALNATLPKLGTGTGAEFSDAAADLAVTITGTNTTTLTADAVNPLSANAAISSDRYEVRWTETSACNNGSGGTTAGSFSVASQPLSSAIETRYTAGESAPTCTSSEVTASLYLAGGSEVLDSIVMDVTLEETTTTTATPDLGLGSGDDYIENVLGLSNNNVLVGEPVTVTVNLVDSDALNALLSERYQFNFTSDCDTSAAFSRANVISSTGTATTTYTPSAVACASGDITVTAQLVDLDTGNNVTGVTATATLNATLPKLGTGTGAGFSDAAADLAVTITGTNTTTLTVDAVNPLSANAAISSDQYEVRWTETSACSNGSGGTTAGSFSVESQSLNSAIETRYTAGESAPTCTSSEVTASLYLAGGSEVLDRVVIAISLTEAGQNEVDEALGANSGAEFIEGALLLSDFDVLVGGSLTVEVSGVNKVDGNSLLADTYQYVFSSTCAETSPATAEFSISQTFSANAAVSSTYRNLGCTSGDTITVKLFEADANPDTAIPLATASAQIDTARPLLGSGFGSSFIEDSVTGETELDGEEETTLTLNLVDPLNANALISSDSYALEWASDIPATCSTGDFSISKQSFDTGAVSTRYSTELSTDGGNDCTGTHTINAIVYERTSTAVCTFADTSGCLDSASITLTITQGVDARLGTGEEGSFSESDISIYPASIGAGSSALISVNIVDANSTPQYQKVNNRSYGVTVTSGCAAQVPAQASFTYTETIVAQGLATFSYTAAGCTGSDEIEVELFKVVDGAIDVTSSLGTATGTISIADIELGAISYNSTTAEAISISTIGDAVLPKQAVLTFTVTDENGGNLENETVEFELTNTTGGIALAQTSDVTNSEGQVTAIINSGTAHSVVAVIAKVQVEGADTADTTDDVYIQTSSQPISITTGIPDQDSFQIAVDVINPGAYDVKGTTVTVTAYAADQYQNPAADGTIVNFTAESGIIEPYCATSSGSCSVTWTSAGAIPGESSGLDRVNEIDPQTTPTNADGILDANGRALEAEKTVIGMTTITAYTVGEAGYTDTDGDGRFDFYDIGTTPSLDSNGDGFVDRDDNSDGKVDEDTNGDGYIDVDLNSDGIVDEDLNGDGYIDVDWDSDSNIDMDSNGDGFYDLDLNSDGDIDLDSNSDGLVDTDVNSDDVIDVDTNDDGFIDVDNNSDGLVDVDLDSDGFIDVDANSDNIIDKDVNSDGFVDVDYNLDSIVDEDVNSDGFIDEDDDNDTVIDAPDVNSVNFRAAVTFDPAVAIVMPVAFSSINIQLPSVITKTDFVASSTTTEPYITLGEVVRDDNWNRVIDTNSSGQYVESFVDYNEDSDYNAAPSSGYQGVMCTTEAMDSSEGHCASLVHVRDSVRIIQSAALTPSTIRVWADEDLDGTYEETTQTNILFDGVKTVGSKIPTGGVFYVLVQDKNGNMPATGTSLTVTGDGFEVSGAGIVSNGLGLLHENGESDYPDLVNLPSFGHVFEITYSVDGIVLNIELSASKGGVERLKTLTP